eukprot:TRINITY_DN23939_c0_g1_i1.p1 TRINITY_DN23939_c0_g1~~TRINITY_DN23939_c0_g1_i1.p1  ORF type:complete len:404 (-),score=71.61 TRINITY_DN23939_c0_g1_i1:439-1650(-)
MESSTWRKRFYEALRKALSPSELHPDPETLVMAALQVCPVQISAENLEECSKIIREAVADHNRTPNPWPPAATAEKLLSAERCVKLNVADLDALPSESQLSRVPAAAFVTVAASVGPFALAPLRAASRSHHKAFHPQHFVPRSSEMTRQHRAKEYWDEPEEQREHPDYVDRDNFQCALDFDVEFESLFHHALDDVFLTIRPKKNESNDRSGMVLELIAEGFAHHDGPEPMKKLMKRCRCKQLRLAMGYIFPTDEPNASFFSRPLHVAVLADNMDVARLLIRSCTLGKVNLDELFLRHHNLQTNFREHTPLFLAMMITSEEQFEPWVELLAAAGARFSDLDVSAGRWILWKLQETDWESEEERENMFLCLQEFDRRLKKVVQICKDSSAEVRFWTDPLTGEDGF